MANHTDLNYVDRGQRGELVKALLTMQACDVAGTSRNRWVSVDSFMRELLPPSQYDSLHGSYPGFWYVDEKASFNEAFLNYGIWFDHTIKVKKGKYSQPSASGSLSCTGRWCSRQHRHCNTQQTFSHRGVMAILEEVKNTEEYKLNINIKEVCLTA